MKSHSWTISNKYCLPDILQQCDTQQFARSSMEIFCDVVFRWMIMCECILHAQIKKMIVCCCCFSIFCHAVHVRVAHELRMWPVISYHRRWLSRCAIFPDMLWIVINCCYHMPLQSEFVFARGLLSYPNLARPRPGILNYYFFFSHMSNFMNADNNFYCGQRYDKKLTFPTLFPRNLSEAIVFINYYVWILLLFSMCESNLDHLILLHCNYCIFRFYTDHSR